MLRISGLSGRRVFRPRTFGVLATGFIAALLIAMPNWAAAQAPEVQRKRPDSKVNRLLDELDTRYRTDAFRDPWARVLKEIVDIGPEAVPDLIAELDSTTSDIMQRNLGFMLRAIGDKRAVPALIRAFPRTCRKPGSDMGCRADDKEILAFMQKHDLDDSNRDNQYGYGRPVREIGGALQKLTGTKQNEEELYHVFLEGNLPQQLAQRKLFYRCAERWTAWWEENWKKHVEDEAYAKVDLPPGDDEPSVVFPHGPDYRLGSSASGHIAESDRADKTYCVFYDLDTGRMISTPKQFRDAPDDVARLDAIQDWAAAEGFDLMGTEFTPPGEVKSRFVIRALGLNAWQVADARWESFEKEIQESEPVKLGRPASGLLLNYDAKTKQFDAAKPAIFLFATREGAFGILRVGVEVLDTDMKDRIGKPVMGDPELDPVGFRKGRRYGYRLVEGAEEAFVK
jgi:hypothetical protein